MLLEGPDDQRFFEGVLETEFLKKFDKIIFFPYAEQTKKAREAVIKYLKHSGIEYIIFSDFDAAACITKSKRNLQAKISTADLAKIAIVKAEIESWYLAGLDYSSTRRLRIPFYPNTEVISKEQFERIGSTKFTSKIDFMKEILKFFSTDTARKQNDSFKYVWQNFIFNSRF